MNNIRELPPFPEGWYFVTSRNALQKKKLLQKTWMGEEIVAWCDEGGRICVAAATCPHMGSNLGPATGGRVRNNRLVCPFHGFEFDATGQCVATPFAPAPKSVRLKLYETRELLGMVFAWWGSGGRAAQWQLPDIPLGGAQWSEVGLRNMRFPGHAQEVAENSVDLAHLRYLHGYDKVRQVGPVTIDGACLRTAFDFKSTLKIGKLFTAMYDVSATVQVYGLGYSCIEVHEKSVGINHRLWVFVTPVDGTLLDLTLASQTQELRNPKRPIAGLRFVPMKLRHRLINQFFLESEKYFTLQDITIWGRKRYRHNPRLVSSDGEIMAYRQYCKQFYPELYSGTNQDGIQSGSATDQPV